MLKNSKKTWTETIDIICKKNSTDLSDQEKQTLFGKKNAENSSSSLMIQMCKSEIQKKIQKLIQNIKDKKEIECNEKSYPMVKPFICVELSEGKNIEFCTFTGNLLDILIGLVFLNKKHSDYLCCILSGDINKKDLNKKYNINDSILDNKRELANFEVIWSNKRLNFGPQFTKNFADCMASKKKFIIIPLGIEMMEGSHAGYLIYDVESLELERFETYGGGASLYGTYYDAQLLDEKLEMRFKEIDKRIKYIRPYDFLPKISFQLMDITEKTKKKIGDPSGFCALWSIWYVDNRIKYREIPRNKLTSILINSAKAKNISFKNMIRNYASNIIDIRDQILKKAEININDWINDQYSNDQFMLILEEINRLIIEIK